MRNAASPEDVFQLTLRRYLLTPDIEGDYSHDPADRGGETWRGISRRNWPRWPGWAVVDREKARLRIAGAATAAQISALIRSLAADTELDALTADFYRQHFWLAFRCHEMPPRVGVCMFCAGVNHRPDTARRLLQRALRVTADGLIGPVTMAAARRADPDELVPEMLSYRAQLYHDIVVSNSTQARFLRGWFRRLFLLQRFVLSEVPQFSTAWSLTSARL